MENLFWIKTSPKNPGEFLQLGPKVDGRVAARKMRETVAQSCGPEDTAMLVKIIEKGRMKQVVTFVSDKPAKKEKEEKKD